MGVLFYDVKGVYREKMLINISCAVWNSLMNAAQ